MERRGTLEGLRTAWQRARRRWWARWALDLAVVALLAAGVMAWQARHLPGAGTPVPDFALRTLSGGQVRRTELLGKPVVLTFWAPWCGVCKRGSSVFSALRRTVGDSAHVLSVAAAYRGEEEVRRYVREQEVDYPVLLGDDALLDALEVDRFPTTFFISPEGRIERVTVGYTTQLGLLWRLWL